MNDKMTGIRGCSYMQNIKTILSLLLLALIFGCQFALVKVAVGSFSPLHLSFLRLLISAIVMISLFMIFYRQHWQAMMRSWKMCLLLAILGEVLAPLFIAAASKDVSSGFAGIIIATAPFFTICLAHFVFRDERVNLSKIIALICGFGGVALLYSQTLFSTDSPSIIPFVLLTAAAASLGAVNIVGKKLGNVNPIAATTLALTFGMFLVFPALVIDLPMKEDFAAWTAPAFFAIAALGIVVNAAGTILFVKIAQKHGATFVSYVGYLIPAVAILIGIIFLDEPLSLKYIAAFIMILIGLLFLKPKKSA